jgi:hypothetical protein
MCVRDRTIRLLPFGLHSNRYRDVLQVEQRGGVEETQSQPDPVVEGAPGWAGPDRADTCSLSSVVTYSLALEEEPYGEDGG